jgi:hypothetical protein
VPSLTDAHSAEAGMRSRDWQSTLSRAADEHNFALDAIESIWCGTIECLRPLTFLLHSGIDNLKICAVKGDFFRGCFISFSKFL